MEIEMHRNVRPSPFNSMFEDFRAELDEHHDRRERIIKASRDITGASKKIIFALQRVRNAGELIPESTKDKTKVQYGTISDNFTSIAPDLQDINEYRYGRNITGGIQEYMEAITFQHYLETQTLLSPQDAAVLLNKSITDGRNIGVSAEDYLLGILDMSGELMRFAVTSMATSGNVPGVSDAKGADIDNKELSDSNRSVLNDLRSLRAFFDGFDTGSDFHFSKDVAKKLEVLRTSVEKVEKAQYGLIVRGSERPKGWIPDINADTRGTEDEF